MSSELLKLNYFKDDDNLFMEMVLYSIVNTYDTLIVYKQHKLIKYYEEGGQQYYEHYKEGFKKRKAILKEKFNEIKAFLYCDINPAVFGVDLETERAYLLNDDEIEEHHQNDKVKFQISNPIDIIKGLEQILTHTGYENTKKILYIVTGLKNLTKKSDFERDFKIPIITISPYED